MKRMLVLALLAWAYAGWLPQGSTAAPEREQIATIRESRIPVGGADLYCREVGKGTPVIVLDGDRFRPELSPARHGPPLRFVPSHLLRAEGTRQISRSCAARGRHPRIRDRRFGEAEAVSSPRLRGIAGALLGHRSRARIRSAVPGAGISPDPHESGAGVQ